jgi:hypothetical protein
MQEEVAMVEADPHREAAEVAAAMARAGAAAAMTGGRAACRVSNPAVRPAGNTKGRRMP